jgi:hypothetical protein
MYPKNNFKGLWRNVEANKGIKRSCETQKKARVLTWLEKIKKIKI